MFLKNRAGMDTMQMVILGIAVVALGLLFVAKFSGGTGTAGDNVNNAITDTGSTLEDKASNIISQ